MAFRCGIAIQYAIERGDDEVQITIDDGNGPREVAIPLDGVWTAKLAALQWQSPIPQSLFDAIQVVRSSGGDPIRAVSMGLHENVELRGADLRDHRSAFFGALSAWSSCTGQLALCTSEHVLPIVVWPTCSSS